MYHVRCFHVGGRSYRSTKCTDRDNSFTSTDEFSPSEELLEKIEKGYKATNELRLMDESKRELEKWFPHTPAVFWSDTCVKHNGFFGMHTSSTADLVPKSSSTDQTTISAAADHRKAVSTSSTPDLTHESSLSSSSAKQTEILAAAEHQKVLSTYFRLIVKTLLSAEALALAQAQAQAPASKPKDYKWYEMGFMSTSSDTGSVLLCCDVPENSINKLFERLPTDVEQIKGGFALHIPLLEVLAELFDESVWSMTKKVRGIEQVSLYE